MLSLNHGSFFITRATSGVAYQMAKSFVRAGYQLVIVGDGVADLKAISKEFSPNYHIEVYGTGEGFADPDFDAESFTTPAPDRLEGEGIFHSSSWQLYGPFHIKDLQEQLKAIYFGAGSGPATIYLVVKSLVSSFVG